MFSRKNIKLFFFPLFLIVLQGCDDDEAGNNLQLSSNKINLMISDKVAGINFTGILPGGMTVDFTPATHFSGEAPVNFVSPSSGYNFTTPQKSFFDAAEFRQSEAVLTLNGQDIHFQYGFCTSYLELRNRFPDLFQSDPALNDLLVFIAIGNRAFEIREVITDKVFKVDDTIIASIFPNRPGSFGGTFTSVQGSRFFLNANMAWFSNQKLTSSGIAVNNFSPNTIFLPYALDLTCLD